MTARRPRSPDLPFRQDVATTPDDLGLGYRVYGEAGPFLVCTNGLGVSTFFWEIFAAAFAPRYQVVVWDFVGHGRSSDPSDRMLRSSASAQPPKTFGGDASLLGRRRPPSVASRHLPRPGGVSRPAEPGFPGSSRSSIVAFAADEITVMDAVGADRAVLLGHSLGAQVNFEVYRRHPERVQALVPTLGTYGRAVETFFGQPAIALRAAGLARWLLPRTHRVLPLLLDPLVRSSLLERSARLTRLVDPKSPPMRGYFEHLTRLDYRVFGDLVADLLTHDAADVLPTIKVPTLVVGAERDLFVPLEVACRMASLIPGAEIEVLPDGTHAALFEQPARFHARVDRFLRERVLEGAGPRPVTRRPAQR